MNMSQERSRFSMKCAYCHGEFDKLTKEHVPPLSYQKYFSYPNEAWLEKQNLYNGEIKKTKKSFQNGASYDVVCKSCNNDKSPIDQEFVSAMKKLESKLDIFRASLTPVRDIDSFLGKIPDSLKLPIRKELIYCFAALSQYYLNTFPADDYEPEILKDNQLLQESCYLAIKNQDFTKLKSFNIYMMMRWGQLESSVKTFQNLTLHHVRGNERFSFEQNCSTISTAYLEFYCVRNDSEFAQRHKELDAHNL